MESVKQTLIKAGSTFPDDKKRAYRRAIEEEKNERARWILSTILENGTVAEQNKSPLCDDTGIPHVLIDVGDDLILTADFLDAVSEGIVEGLRALPGRPMAVLGDDMQRLAQSEGMDPDSGALAPAPFMFRKSPDGKSRIYVLMFGGGPAIRAKTYRVFHKHDSQTVIDEIVEWSREAVSLLGCTPCTLAVGIGRSHYEAASMMLQAQIDGSYDCQSEVEAQITRRVNETDVGPLGLHGDTSVLATFLKVGPQRASGVRIVCVRPCCCFEPRVASVLL